MLTYILPYTYNIHTCACTYVHMCMLVGTLFIFRVQICVCVRVFVLFMLEDAKGTFHTPTLSRNSKALELSEFAMKECMNHINIELGIVTYSTCPIVPL